MQLHSAGLRCLARWARRGCPVPGITWIRSRCRRQPVGDSPDVISAVFIRSSRRPRGRRTGQKQITRAPSNVQSSQDAASDGESTSYVYREGVQVLSLLSINNLIINMPDDALHYILK